MAKSKSKIPVRRPFSEEGNTQSKRHGHQSALRRISSALSKPINRTNDENSVHSLDLNNTNLRVRRFTVTIKDSRGEFVKRRKSYKLTYDENNDGGDEYDIEKESINDSFARVGHENNILKDLSNDASVTETFDDSVSAYELPQRGFKKEDKRVSNLTAPSYILPFSELETSKTIVTDDTSLPVLDDDSSESVIPLGDTYTIDKGRTLLSVSPASGTTIRLLTPQDRNETNILFKDFSRRKIAKVRKAEAFASTVGKSKERENMTNETEFRIKATPVTKEDTNNSLPPFNFKANLFNRFRKISTPRRKPKFSPVQSDITYKKKVKSLSEHKRRLTDNAPLRQKVKSGFTENTFVKDSSAGIVQRSAPKHVKAREKKLKRELVEDSKMTSDEEERYEPMDLDNTLFMLKPKRHRRSLEAAHNEEKTDTIITVSRQKHSGLKFSGVILNKPVLKTTVKSNKPSQENNLLSQNNFIGSSTIDISTIPDKKSKLKHAQIINEDLKIVKSKLKDSEFVAQHLDSKIREIIQKKTVLTNLNKTSTKKQNNETKSTETTEKPERASTQLRTEPKHSKKHDTKRLPGHSNDLRDSSIVVSKIDYRTLAKLNIQPGAPNLPESKQNAWQPQPKIHRFNPNKTRQIRKKHDSETGSSEAPNHTNSVATWILHSANGAKKTDTPMNRFKENKIIPLYRRRKIHQRRKVVQAKRMQRKESINTLSTSETASNLINEGLYLPLGIKKLKRRPKRLKPRLYTQVGKVKGYESEIPVLYNSDDEDVYPEPRPLTDTADRRYPNYRRYEGENDKVRINYRDPAHKKIGRTTGALVRFFRNGDKDHKGVPLTINSRNFKNLMSLLEYLEKKIPTPTGIKHIFKWPDGSEINSITDFKNRCVYVVSSSRSLRRDVNYGESREGFWCNKKPSAGRLRKNEAELYKGPISPKESPVRNAPLVVTIINNLSRDKREKVILNPQTQQTFEQWLEDIANHDMPVKTLYSEKAPYMEVKSFSHLFRELRTNSNFIACGEELKPVEVLKKRQAPSSNSSTDSVGDSRYRKKKLPKQQEMDQIYENGRPESPTSTAMSRYDTGPRYHPLRMRGRPKNSRQTYTDNGKDNAVVIEIDGVIKEFYPPTEPDVNDDGGRPEKLLKCEWVYGYRGKDAQNLLVLPKTGELVYYVAAVVVLYDKDRDEQRHYIKHNEEITCMTMHPNGYLIATGQLHGKDPEHASHIRIWDGESLSTYFVIGLGVFFGGVLSIDFSSEEVEGKRTGRMMCVLDGSEKHVLSVWDWQKERLIARTTTSTDAVHSACFYPEDKNNSILVSYGVRHIYFWKIFYDIARQQTAKILRDRNSGIFEVKKKDQVPKSINCIAFLKCGDVVTGDSSGNLMVWDRDHSDAFTCRHVIPAHKGTIMSLCLLDDGMLLSTSGNEIKTWDTNMDYRLGKSGQILREAGNIRTLVPQLPGGTGGRFYVGTTTSAILEGSLQERLQDRFRHILEGHSDNMWGVVSIPNQPYFVSAGFDKVVYKWSQGNHKVIWRTQIEAPCTSLAVNHRLETIAIGTADGTLVILNSYNGMHIATVQVVDEPIGCLAFSRDLSYLAMGCHDGTISILKMPDKQTFNIIDKTLKGHKSGVAHLDWSKDGRWIQSSSFDNELMFWDFYNMQQIRIPWTMRDVEWLTNTCHLAYSLIGPWSNMEKGEVLRAVNRSYSPDSYLLVTGDSRGRIRLYKNPSTKEKAEYRGARIYSSDVTAVAFTSDNTGVLTCGGNDAALVQWALVDEAAY